ncbi:Telomerase reverse transcriptase [Umbelopsis nana]
MLNLPSVVMASAAAQSNSNVDEVYRKRIESNMMNLLMLEVFPKQFGKPNVLDGTKLDVTGLPGKNLAMQWKVGIRNGEQKVRCGPFLMHNQPNMRKLRIPPRLRQLKNYFETMCKRHTRCRYTDILNQFCPTSGSGSMQHSTHAQVTAYLIHCIKAIIPQPLWGSRENIQQISKVISVFVGLRKHETLSLRHLLQSIKLKDFACLAAHSTKPTGFHLPPSEMLKREEILKECLYWLFQSYLIPLISATFYVTDNSKYRNRTFYFRKDVWHALSKTAIEQLISVHFSPFDQMILESLKLDYASLRLLPKGDSVRPITNMRRRTVVETVPESLGSSIMSFDEFYQAFSVYKQAYLQKGSAETDRPALYFSKVDIKGCYDSIDQDILINIINKVLSQDEYLIRRYSSAFSTTGGKVHYKHTKFAQSADEFVPFPQYALKLSNTLPNTIFILHSYEDKDDLLDIINEHIKCNVVKIGNSYYRRTIGIPQGSCLSTILCSYFYGQMEHEELGFIKEDPDALMMRFVDDFLCISTCRDTVEWFTRAMHQGFARYGCQVSHSKSLVNFDMTLQGTAVTKLQASYEFPWCGFLIDTRDLEVFSNYQQYLGGYIQDTLTTELNRQPGQTLLHKAMLTMKPKLRPIFVHSKFNRQSTIGRNIFEAFLICALKLFSQVAILNAGENEP